MVPCCFDTKRGLFVITMNNPIPNGTPRNDIYTFNGATRTWQTVTPPSKPPFNCGSLAYDPVNDLYVYIGGGTCPLQLWTYSPVANTWTQPPLSGRAYNESSPGASTWPPERTQNTWNYSPKHNALFTWGTTEWDTVKACLDDGYPMPFWVYRTAPQGANIGQGSALARAKAFGINVLSSPFSRAAEIRYTLPEKSGSARVKLTVLDAQGRLVGSPVNGMMEAGTRTARWDASSATPGIYLFRLEAGGRTAVRRSVLIR
jgi:hypothetical protein